LKRRHARTCPKDDRPSKLPKSIRDTSVPVTNPSASAGQHHCNGIIQVGTPKLVIKCALLVPCVDDAARLKFDNGWITTILVVCAVAARYCRLR
jgi:hypothetical protein